MYVIGSFSGSSVAIAGQPGKDAPERVVQQKRLHPPVSEGRLELEEPRQGDGKEDDGKGGQGRPEEEARAPRGTDRREQKTQRHGETDGPLGAVSLARAVKI